MKNTLPINIFWHITPKLKLNKNVPQPTGVMKM